MLSSLPPHTTSPCALEWPYLIHNAPGGDSKTIDVNCWKTKLHCEDNAQEASMHQHLPLGDANDNEDVEAANGQDLMERDEGARCQGSCMVKAF